jgi:hypothetical protein
MAIPRPVIVETRVEVVAAPSRAAVSLIARITSAGEGRIKEGSPVDRTTTIHTTTANRRTEIGGQLTFRVRAIVLPRKRLIGASLTGANDRIRGFDSLRRHYPVQVPRV